MIVTAESPSSSPEKVFRTEKVDRLSRFETGRVGTIVEIFTEPDLQGRLMGMGLFTGTRFQLLQGGNHSYKPILLAVGETRIALNREIADQILVEE